MAIFLSYNCFSYLSMLLIISTAGKLVSADTNAVELVCSEVEEDHAYCRSILASDPRSANADLTGLGGIAISLASQSANTTAAKIKSLMKSEKDRKRHGHLSACGKSYVKAIDSLAQATQHLKNRQYGELNLDGGPVLGEAEGCESEFRSGSPLTQENRFLAILGGILRVIAYDLGGRK